MNWAYLASTPAIAELPGYDGVKVPQLVFRKEGEKNGRTEGAQGRDSDHFAIVYILDRGRFRLDDMARPTSGYKYTAEVYEHAGCNYLVLYTGDSWAWLKAAE